MPQERTFNTYETTHCWNNDTVHDYIKFLKYGYGKATDHASRDIRLKRMSRNDGIKYVQQYDHLKPSTLNKFLEWIEMSEEELMDCINRFRDPSIWQLNQKNQWELQDSIVNHINDSGIQNAALEIADPKKYINTELLEDESSSDEYILMGRVYMDENNYKAIEG